MAKKPKRTSKRATKPKQTNHRRRRAKKQPSGEALALMGQSLGTAAPLLLNDPLVAALGGVTAIFSMLVVFGLGVTSARRLRDEIDATRDVIESMPVELRQGKPWERYFAPMILRHFAYAMKERHLKKLEAARTHLRNCLSGGIPDDATDRFHQVVESFLDQCEEIELILLLQGHLTALTGAPFVVERGDEHDPYLRREFAEEQLAKLCQVLPTEAALAFKALEGRRFLMHRAVTGREEERLLDQLPFGDAVIQTIYSMTARGRRVAEWLESKHPPSCGDEVQHAHTQAEPEKRAPAHRKDRRG